MDFPDSPPSLWLAEYGRYEPGPSLAGDISVDVAVIGGGFLGDDRTAVYGLGCIGHGVAMSYLNGEVLADLLTGASDGATARQCPFVSRRVISWPPEPAATAARYAIRGYLQAEDAFHEHASHPGQADPQDRPPAPAKRVTPR